MQQKQNTEQNQKKTGSFARMMAQRDKGKLEERKKQDELARYRKPRGKEYMRLLAKVSELCDQLSELDDEIELMEQELEEETAEQEVEQPPASLWTEAVPQTPTVSWTQTVSKGAALMQQMKEKQQRVRQLKQQRDAMVAELREAQKQFEAQLPAPEKLVGMIYPLANEEILMKYGVISCPGNTYHSPEELLAQVQPKTRKEEEQWLKGDRAYNNFYSDNLLLVEIYLEVICVVYKDGEVTVLED